MIKKHLTVYNERLYIKFNETLNHKNRLLIAIINGYNSARIEK